MVIGADTVVAYHGQVLGKPADEADAKRTLMMLSGQTHEVYTGVCLIEDGEADANIICFKLVYLLCCFLYRNVISI